MSKNKKLFLNRIITVPCILVTAVFFVKIINNIYPANALHFSVLWFFNRIFHFNLFPVNVSWRLLQWRNVLEIVSSEWPPSLATSPLPSPRPPRRLYIWFILLKGHVPWYPKFFSRIISNIFGDHKFYFSFCAVSQKL